MKKEIRILWNQIEHKSDFIMELAKKVKRSPKTLRTHWFSKDKINTIPADMEQTVIKELRKKIKEQNQNY